MSDVTPLAAARWRKRNAVQGVKDALAELRVANRQLAVAEGRPVPQLRLACGHGAEGNSEQDEGCRAEDAPTHPLDAAEGSAGVHGHDETPAGPEGCCCKFCGSHRVAPGSWPDPMCHNCIVAWMTGELDRDPAKQPAPTECPRCGEAHYGHDWCQAN